MRKSNALSRVIPPMLWWLVVAMNATVAAETSAANDQKAGPITTGLRVCTCGHSFHAPFVPSLVSEIAESAKIKGHVVVATSFIGGSRVIQHFKVPDAKNPAKAALLEGKVDVLTFSCMERPDEGIRMFAELAVKHNPDIRITLQELWLPEDRWPFDANHRVNKSRLTFNDSTIDALKATHAAYFKVMEDYVTALNTSLGRQTVFIVPDAQATLALRERIIAGTAHGLQQQADLFVDPWGHPKPVLQLLSAYCHFAVIYRRTPVGLPIPPISAGRGIRDEALNRLLQELAWDAVIHHPLSGVREAGEPGANAGSNRRPS